MMSNNIVGYCFPDRTLDKTSPFDIGEFFTRLLLFDTVFLKSVRLNEIAILAKCIGPEQTISLLQSGTLKLIVDSLSLASTGQNGIVEASQERGGPLPLGSYSFHAISLSFNKEKTSEILRNVKPKDLFVKMKIFKKLKFSVVESIMESPDKIRYLSMGAIISDLKNNIDSIPYLITKKLGEKKQFKNIQLSDIKVKTIELREKDFRVETNLQSLLGITIKEEHQIVQSSLLALGAFNQRILEMEAYDAVTVLDDEDYALFDQKYKFLSNTLVKNDIQTKLSRVINIVGLPDFSEVGEKYRIDIDKLLKIKRSEEFLLFRHFLRNSNELTDQELEKLFKSLKTKFSNASNSPIGKTVRMLIGAGVGLIPGIGTPLSLAVSAADQYLFEKIMPSKGVISFINRGYPSIFKEKNC